MLSEYLDEIMPQLTGKNPTIPPMPVISTNIEDPLPEVYLPSHGAISSSKYMEENIAGISSALERLSVAATSFSDKLSTKSTVQTARERNNMRKLTTLINKADTVSAMADN